MQHESGWILFSCIGIFVFNWFVQFYDLSESTKLTQNNFQSIAICIEHNAPHMATKNQLTKNDGVAKSIHFNVSNDEWSMRSQ